MLYDLCYYWAHRMDHEVNVMWPRVVQYTTRRSTVNLSTAAKQASTGALFGCRCSTCPGGPRYPVWQMLVIVGLIDLLYQYWVHARLIGRLGILDHHSGDAQQPPVPQPERLLHRQRTMAASWSCGTVCSGTFADERDDEKICYGIRKPLHELQPDQGNLHHYADLADVPCGKGLARQAGCLGGATGRLDRRTHRTFRARTFTRFDVQTPRRCAGTWRCSARCWCLFFAFHRVWLRVWTEARPRCTRWAFLVTAVALGRCLSVLSGASGWNRCVCWRWVCRSPPCRSGLALRRRCCSRGALLVFVWAVWSG